MGIGAAAAVNAKGAFWFVTCTGGLTAPCSSLCCVG